MKKSGSRCWESRLPWLYDLEILQENVKIPIDDFTIDAPLFRG